MASADLARQRPAQGEPRTECGREDRRFELLAAGGVEEDVDAVRRESPEPIPYVVGFVVDGDVVPEFVDDVAAFSGPPADPMTNSAPRALAICPATDPTPPAAPLTNTTSPVAISAMSTMPWYAVTP